MLRRSCALFQQLNAKELSISSTKNRESIRVDTSSVSTFSLSIFTVDERARRIQHAKDIDIPTLEELDKELITRCR